MDRGICGEGGNCANNARHSPKRNTKQIWMGGKYPFRQVKLINQSLNRKNGRFDFSIYNIRGTHFTANAVRDACKILNIPWTYTTASNPKASRVESAHKTLGRMITALTQGKQEQWQLFLPSALFALRTNTNRSTGFPPYRLLFGRDASMDLELYFSKPNQPEEFRDYDDYAVKLKERIQRATRWTQENIGGAIRRQRRAYCQRKKRYEVGQKVWLFTPRRKVGESGKWRSNWTGPWTVSRILNDLTYELNPHPSWPRKGREVVSIDRLMAYYSDEDDEDDEGKISAPSQSDDLSMEGDEHAEQVNLPYVERDDEESDDEDYGFGPAEPQQEAPAAPPGPPAAEEQQQQEPPPPADVVDGERVVELPQEVQRAAAAPPARAAVPPDRPVIRPARLIPQPGPDAERPGTPAPKTPPHPQFGTPFFTPGASPREDRMRWRQARRDSEDDGSSPPEVRRSPRLQRVEEEAPLAGPSTSAPAPTAPPPTGAEQGEKEKKKGRPFKVREQEYREAKEAERRRVQEDAARRDREREERTRRREEKARQKELGRKYGYEPDL